MMISTPFTPLHSRRSAYGTPSTDQDEEERSHSSSTEFYDMAVFGRPLYNNCACAAATAAATAAAVNDTTTTATTVVDTTVKKDCVAAGRCVNSCTAYGRVCPHYASIATAYAEKALTELREHSRLFDTAQQQDAAVEPQLTAAEEAAEETKEQHPPTVTTTMMVGELSDDDCQQNEEQDGETDKSDVEEKSTDDSSSCRSDGLPAFYNFQDDDIVRGEKIGEGGFSLVHACTVRVGPAAGRPAAVKFLKRKAMVDLHQFKHGAADLVTEAYVLQTLHHRHIIRLHGCSAAGPAAVTTCDVNHNSRGSAFYLVLDRLHDTLEKRLERWRQEEQAHPANVLTRRTAEYKERKREELRQRIRIAIDIATAVEYLHSKNIIFCDLKPDNIGFDQDGVLKLFDFGLVKELKPNQRLADGRYTLTGNTGSRRYMAPEVAKECPYDCTVDSYSFGILLWELCAATKPFYGYSSGKHMQLVVLGGERPALDGIQQQHWPTALQWLLQRCWSAVPADRPNFTVIKQTLVAILQEEDVPAELLAPVTGDHSISSRSNSSSASAEQEILGATRDDLHLRPPPPASGFGALFKNMHKVRFKSTGDIDPAAQQHRTSSNGGVFSNLKRPKPHLGGGHRSSSRNWGFGLRR